MTEKAGLTWKLRGYPYKVTVKTADQIDWRARISATKIVD